MDDDTDYYYSYGGFPEFLEDHLLIAPLEWEHIFRVACLICPWEETAQDAVDWQKCNAHFHEHHPEIYQMYVLTQ